MTRDDIIIRLGELTSLIEDARGAQDIPSLSSLTEERDSLRAILRASAPICIEDMQAELEGLRSHLARFPATGTMEVALGEDSMQGMVSAVEAVTSQQGSADPHSAPAWIRQRIAFLEEQIAKA